MAMTTPKTIGASNDIQTSHMHAPNVTTTMRVSRITIDEEKVESDTAMVRSTLRKTMNPSKLVTHVVNRSTHAQTNQHTVQVKVITSKVTSFKRRKHENALISVHFQVVNGHGTALIAPFGENK